MDGKGGENLNLGASPDPNLGIFGRDEKCLMPFPEVLNRYIP